MTHIWTYIYIWGVFHRGLGLTQVTKALMQRNSFGFGSGPEMSWKNITYQGPSMNVSFYSGNLWISLKDG